MLEQHNLFRSYPMVPARVHVEAFRSRNPLRDLLNSLRRLLSFTLAAIFFWFGVLKLTGVSPAVQLLADTAPMVAESPLVAALAWAEIVIALGLVFERFRTAASVLMMIGLIFYTALVWLSPAVAFAPASWELTAQGKFLATNLALLFAGLFALGRRGRQ